MPDVTVAPATPADIPRLCELLELLFAQEVEFTPDRARQSAALERIIGDGRTGFILAARAAGGIIGMVNVLLTVSTAQGGPVAILEDLIVDPAYRGKGAGTKLAQAAIEQCRAAGCSRITLLTDSTNEQGAAFYRKQGFVFSTMRPMRLFLQD